MEFIPIKTSQCGKLHISVDDLLRELSRLGKNDTSSSIVNLKSEFTESAALVDFFKDIQNYKQELEEINKAHESVTVLQQNPSEFSRDVNSVNLTSGEKYFLIQPETLTCEKPVSLDLCPPGCSPTKESLKCLPESTVSSESTVKPAKLRKNALALDAVKPILIAQPEVIEFHNCEARKTYQKRVILQNITTQLTRYCMESQPSESPFAISIEENRELIAPGMNAKIFVQLDYDGLSEPEERLVINVPNGQSVTITMRALRDPPILQVLAQTCSTLCLGEQSSKSSLSSSMTMGSSSNESCSGSLSMTESTSYGSSTFDRYGQHHPSFDCKKCFVGEFVVISTLIKNIGGKGRFFIMSETDWCLLKIKDVTTNNMLIVPPFAMWPAYFLLEPGEMLILYTYFFPEASGLQVMQFNASVASQNNNELYIISDNCSVKTIEVIGDGVVFERQSLEFNNNVKYQWFQMKNKELCTMRYMDLGVGDANTLLGGTFTMTSKCDLDVHYRWEVSDIILCPSIYKITIGLGKTNFPVGQMRVEPSSGVFRANSTITFRVIADLNGVKRDRYRTTLRLIIEDLPRAAVPERFNFQCTESQNKRRLCENPVDINFEDIDVRFKCERMVARESSSYQNNGTIETENSLQAKSLADVTRVFDDSEFWQSPFLCAPDAMDDQQSPRSDHICRFIKGYGTCDCCQTTMISTAVLRPGSPLFLGVTSKFAIILCNRSSTRIKYWWSQPVGSDHSKMRIKFDPPDSIAPNSCRAVELKCLPLETGNISSIFIACQFDARNPVVLSIECVVRSLCVVFYFPPMTDETNENYYARVEWNADEYVSKYDKKSGRIQLFSMRSREEETILVAKLNSDRSSGKSSDEADISSYEQYEGDYSSIDDTNTSNDEVDQKATEFDELRISHDFLNDSFEYQAESFIDENEHLRLLPYVDWYSDYLKKHFRYQPLVYEIRVNAHKIMKKRIYIRNDSPIASYFRIYVKNFWAHQAFSDGQNILLDSNELQTGIQLRIKPNRGEIKPHEKVYFDLVVSSTTWGVYTDQITVEIDYLPPFTFWIRIINDDPPIVYPACKNSSVKVPTIRFTAFKAGYLLEQRKVLLENTSDVPLYVNWHCFLIDDNEDEEKPFNVVLDMVSPLISIYDLLLTDPVLMEAIEKFLRCAYDRCDSDDDLAEVGEGEGEGESSGGLENSQNSVSSGTKCPSDLTTSSSNIDSESDITPVSNKKPVIKPTHTEFQIGLVPYYGKLVTDLFIITPEELYLPPKSKKYIHIDVDTEKMTRYNGKAYCKACGFIRIPPIFKYQDNTYHRKDGYFIDPLELNLGCELRRPRFHLRSSKCECTFEFHTKHFLQQATNTLRMAKKILFKNFDVKSMNVTFKIDKPFSVSRLLMEGKVIGKNTVVVPPNECVLIRIKCFITKNWVEEAKNYNEHDPHDVNSLTLSRWLKIIYKEGFCQYHEIYVRTIFPSLAISTTHLNFGKVLSGDRKSLQFEIRNLSEWPQTFELQRSKKVDDFIICIDKALLVGKNQTSMDRLAVEVSFVPMNPGKYKETVKVISEVDGLVFDCILEGSSRS